MKVYREDGARLFLKTKKNRHKLEEGILQLGTITIISLMKSYQKFEQFVQRAGTISILCDIPNPDGHGRGKPNLPLKLVLLLQGFVSDICSN